MTDEKKPFINPQSEGSNAVFSRKGKEVVRSNHSEQITTLKNQLESFQISEITQTKIDKKIEKARAKTRGKLGVGVLGGFVLSNVPIVGMFSSAMLMETAAEAAADGMKEQVDLIIKKLVNTAINDLENQKTELIGKLVTLSEQVNDRESGLLAEIDKLTLEIAKMENQLDQYKEAEKRVRERQEARIRKGQTLDSKAIVDLRTAQERIRELEAEISDLEEQLEDMTILRDGAEIRVNEWKGKTELKQHELDNAINSLEILNQRVEDARKERDEAQTELNALKNVKLKNKKDKIANLKKRVNDLEKELKKHEPSMLYQVAEKLGIIQLKNSISNVLIIAGAVVVLYAISWMWRYLIKPTYRNFKSDDEEEPRPRKKEKVRYEDYEEISEAKEKPQSLPEKQPTIIINNSTPAEKEANQSPVISKETVKQEEILTQISDEKETLPLAKKNGSKEKKKNKKKVKGDGS